MKKRIERLASAALIALGLIVMSATATARPICVGRNATSRDAGELIGRNIVDQAWLAVGEDPLLIDQFKRVVRRIVRQTVRGALIGGDPSDFVRCRTQGLIDGIRERINEIQDEIARVCLLDGEFWGALTGELYCALAIAFDGLGFLDLELPEPSDLTCGANFEAGCFDAFEGLATSDAACAPYTVAPHTDAYEENLALSCVFLF